MLTGSHYNTLPLIEAYLASQGYVETSINTYYNEEGDKAIVTPFHGAIYHVELNK